MSDVIFPRFHLAEIEDQSWCPSFLREHSHAMLAQMWRTCTSERGTPAQQACDILLRNLGGTEAASQFTFVDSCAGAGGPTPALEPAMNQALKASGAAPVSFVLTDLWPDLVAWKSIVARSKNITFIPTPIDATKPRKLAEEGKKECRMFNLCFHHFDDDAAKLVLNSAVESSDAFIIFEMTHRTWTSILNTTIATTIAMITTIVTWWHSPIHLLFTYLIPIVPIFYMIDGYVSCARGRTPDETWALLPTKTESNLAEWKFTSGQQLVLPPFGVLYWYAGVKQQTS